MSCSHKRERQRVGERQRERERGGGREERKREREGGWRREERNGGRREGAGEGEQQPLWKGDFTRTTISLAVLYNSERWTKDHAKDKRDRDVYSDGCGNHFRG